jgi:hypothetical protein
MSSREAAGVIAGLRPVSRFGRDRATVADQPEHEARADGLPDAQRLPDERRAVREDRLRHRDLAVGEVLHVDGAWEQDRLGEVLGRRQLRVDDEVDTEQVAGEGGILAEVLRIADPRDRPSGAELVPGEGGDEVDLVALRHRTQQVGVARPQLAEEPGRRPVAGDDHRVELTLHRLDAIGVGIDHGHVVTFGAQRPGDVLPDFADPDDDHAHQCIVCPHGAIARQRMAHRSIRAALGDPG